MRCHICNARQKKPRFDKITHKSLPCEDCDLVILESVLELEAQEIEQTEKKELLVEDAPPLS